MAQNNSMRMVRNTLRLHPEPPQSLGKLLIDAAESAIGENGNHISLTQFGRNRVHDGIGIGKDAGLLSALFDFIDHAIQIKTLRFRNRLRLEDGSHYDLIGEREA